MTNPFQQTPASNPFAAQAAAGSNPFAAQTAAAAQPQQSGVNPADLFGDPAKQSDRPRLQDIGVGRLVVIAPKKIETVRNNLSENPNATQDRVTADVVVLDGGAIAYGGKPEDGQPHTKSVDAPVKFPDMFISQKGLVSQLRDALAARLAGKSSGYLVIGRLTKGQAKQVGYKPPWLLAPASAEDKAAAAQYLVQQNPFA